VFHVERNVSGRGHGLISVNPGTFLYIQQTTTDTPKSRYPVWMLRFEPERNRMHKDPGEFLRCVNKKFVLLFRRIALPPPSGHLSSVSFVSGMTERRECVHSVAELDTIGPG
jgi:hypothetical protein